LGELATVQWRAISGLAFSLLLLVSLSALAASMNVPRDLVEQGASVAPAEAAPTYSVSRVAPKPLWNFTFGDTGFDEAWEVIEAYGWHWTNRTFVFVGSTESTDGFGDQWCLVTVPAEGWVNGSFWSMAESSGGNGTEVSHAIVQARDGHLIFVGSTDSVASHAVGGSDVYMQSEGNDGIMVPDSTYGGLQDDVGWSVVEDPGGGFVIVGTTRSAGAGTEDLWLLHTDPEKFQTGPFGNHTPLLWNRTYGGTADDGGYDIVSCAGGGFAIGGYTVKSPSGNRDAWLVRTDAAGNFLWNQTYGGGDVDEFYSLVECRDGGFALTGITHSFGAHGQDMWLVRTNASGSLLWQRVFGGDDSDAGQSVIEVSDGGFAVAGYTQKSPSDRDMWLVRTDADGNRLWDCCLGGVGWDEGRSVIEVSRGGFAIAGSTYLPTERSDMWLVVLPEDWTPAWVEPPANQTVWEGTPLRYDLNATDSSGLGHWWVNDTAHFVIDAAGVVRNATILLARVYGLQVCVDDIYGNTLTTTFVVVVKAFPVNGPPPLLGPVLLMIGLVCGVASGGLIALSSALRRWKKHAAFGLLA